MEQAEKVRQELRDGLVKYELSAASERNDRDVWLVIIRNTLHSALQQPGSLDPKIINMVIDSIDQFLNRAGGRRK